MYNAGALPVDLAGWTLSDAGDGVVLPHMFLLPDHFLVLTTDSLSFVAARGAGAAVVPVRLPALNNGEDQVRLHNAAGILVDSMLYKGDWIGGNGLSLERRWYADSGGDSASWSTCRDSAGATPGRENSILPFRYNVTLDSVAFNNHTATFTVRVRNTGLEAIEAAELVFYRDGNGDGVPDEEQARHSVPVLRTREDVALEIPWKQPLTDAGEPVLVAVEDVSDEFDADDIRTLLIRATPPVEGLVITEIMYEPLPVGENSGAEYIEFYNLLARPVPLDGWTLADESDRTIQLPQVGFSIPPGSFGVITSDSSIYEQFPQLRDTGRVLVLNLGLGFGNDGDAVVLRNPLDATVDSVRYVPGWHWKGIEDTRGVSLERLILNEQANDAANWSSSVARNGGTPGEQNSRHLPEVAGDAVLRIEPETLSPDGDGFQDFARISWNLPGMAARMVIDVYDRWGRRVARPVNNVPVPASGNIIWDGFGANGKALSTGIYIVLMRTFDEDGRVLTEARRAMTLARRL